MLRISWAYIFSQHKPSFWVSSRQFSGVYLFTKVRSFDLKECLPCGQRFTRTKHATGLGWINHHQPSVLVMEKFLKKQLLAAWMEPMQYGTIGVKYNYKWSYFRSHLWNSEAHRLPFGGLFWRLIINASHNFLHAQQDVSAGPSLSYPFVMHSPDVIIQ